MTFASLWLGLASLFSELGLAWRKRSSRGAASGEMDEGSLALLWRVIGCFLTIGILLAAFRVGPTFPRGIPWGWISIGIFALGTLLRWWAIWHLGKFFTVNVAISQDHRVVDTGPYRWMRHPSYTGLLLQFIAIGVSLANYLGLAVILLPIGWAVLRRIHIEERVLSANLGEAYTKYASRTKRLVPLLY